MALGVIRPSLRLTHLTNLRLAASQFSLRTASTFAPATSSMTQPPPRPRRFAPLDPAKSKEARDLPVLQGIIFDVDGTLSLQIQKPTDILDHIYSLPDEEQKEAQEKIRAIERTAMSSQQPQPGLVTLMDYLDSRSVRKGICTRNFDAPVNHLLTTFLPSSKFAPVITREFRPPKPDPAGILHIAKEWGCSDGGRGLIMVGDSIDDMTAGHRAGAATVLLVNRENEHLAEHAHTDLTVTRLDGLISVLEEGFEGRCDGVGEGSATAE